MPAFLSPQVGEYIFSPERYPGFILQFSVNFEVLGVKRRFS